MHDHSRFQRDINDVTGVSLSLSLSLSLSPLLTKVTDAQYRKRFRASYNQGKGSCLTTDHSRSSFFGKLYRHVISSVHLTCFPEYLYHISGVCYVRKVSVAKAVVGVTAYMYKSGHFVAEMTVEAALKLSLFFSEVAAA